MKIFYSPAFSANTYFDWEVQGISFDEKVCGNTELFGLFGLHLGIHRDILPSVEREAQYYNVFREYIDKNPKSIFTDSFSFGGMTVSSRCLQWRDKLMLAGWNPEIEQPSERLATLAEVEKFFKCPGEVDCIKDILEAMDKKCPLPKGSEVLMFGLERNLLPPYVERAMKALERDGVKVEKVQMQTFASGNLGRIQRYLLGCPLERLEPNDDSFRVLEFPDEMTALQYVASIDKDKYDVYINSDNKKFDDLQCSLNCPVSGSSIVNGSTQIVQVFKIGLSLFDYPMNIVNVLSWLVMPFSPIDGVLRYSLARVITDKGGMCNKEWNQAVRDYLETTRNKDEDRNTREKNVAALDVFLPRSEEEGVDIAVLKKYIEWMLSWSDRKMNGKNLAEFEVRQFGQLVSMFKALNIVTNTEVKKCIPYSQLEQWMNAIFGSMSCKYRDAERKARFVVSSPGDLAADAESILWMDFYNYIVSPSYYDFLNLKEKQALTEAGCYLWNEDKETELYNKLYLIPVLRCRKRLTAIEVKRREMKMTNRHPLRIRLERTFENLGFESIYRESTLPQEYLKKEALVINDNMKTEIRIKNADKMKFPDHESSTSLDLLIQHPYDYVMQTLGKFRNGTSYQLDANNLSLTKGNVAHAVIQGLFTKNDFDLDKLESKFDTEFEGFLKECIAGYGAVLLMKENRTEHLLFRKQLYDSIRALMDIIKSCNLKVEGCESEIIGDIGFDKGTLIKGFLDMTLSDSNGDQVIFDFKWSRIKKYTEKLKGNRAMQLAIYEALLSAEKDKNVAVKGYFIMPDHVLLTTNENFKGTDVRFIKPTEISPLLPKIKASYSYRRTQLEGGLIETADGCKMSTDAISYFADAERKNLYPLEEYDGYKSDNLYSNYKLFTGQTK